jgi:hypothetical protein
MKASCALLSDCNRSTTPGPVPPISLDTSRTSTELLRWQGSLPPGMAAQKVCFHLRQIFSAELRGEEPQKANLESLSNRVEQPPGGPLNRHRRGEETEEAVRQVFSCLSWLSGASKTTPTASTDRTDVDTAAHYGRLTVDWFRGTQSFQLLRLIISRVLEVGAISLEHGCDLLETAVAGMASFPEFIFGPRNHAR